MRLSVENIETKAQNVLLRYFVYRLSVIPAFCDSENKIFFL